MKITELRTTVVSVPYREPEVWADGRREGVNNVLVEVITDEGIVGFGESTAGSGGSVEAVRAAIMSSERLLLGHDPERIEAFIRSFYGHGRWHHYRVFANTALAGLEMALWDIVGKAYGMPASTLFGGKVRDQISLYAYIMRNEPEEMAGRATQLLEQGFDVFYVKAGMDQKEDEAILDAIRGAIGPDKRLRVDVNEAWDEGTAAQRIHRLARFDLDFVEQPVRDRDLDALGRLRAATGVRIAANQSTWTMEQVFEVAKRGVADVIVTGLHWVGGMLQLKKSASIAQAAGVPFCRHSGAELGVASAAGHQVLATVPNLSDGNQTYYPHIEDDLLIESLPYEDGGQLVPSGPGLGVEVDPDKVGRYAAQYDQHGPYLTVLPDRSGRAGAAERVGV